MSCTREELVAEAYSWIDTPWQHGQSCKYVGCDCIGAIRGMVREKGLDDPFVTGRAQKFAGYGPQPVPELLLEACDLYMDRISIAAIQLADILVMSFVKNIPQHFGIVSKLNPTYIIHCLAGAGKVAENRIDGIWARRIVRAYALRGLANG